MTPKSSFSALSSAHELHRLRATGSLYPLFASNELLFGLSSISGILGPVATKADTKHRLFVPTRIPWNTLKGRDLEECLYWLVDGLGGKELQWRTGTTGKSSPDQGRDLEACFYTPSPAAEPVREKWWFDAKGRSEVVEPRVVHEVLHRILNRNDIDVIVIATNSAFSNPTRDWVTQWQAQTPRPRVYLWDRHDLERLLSRHPVVVLRLFPSSLNAEGRVAANTARFWDYTQYIDSATLKIIWAERLSVMWNSESLMAHAASEFANGDIDDRPWISLLPNSKIIRTLQMALRQSVPFCFRAEDAGTKTEPYTDAVGYLILKCLQIAPAAPIDSAIRASWRRQSSLYPEGAQDFILQTVFRNLMNEVFKVCASDCRRITHSGSDEVRLQDVGNYWRRFTDHDNARPKEARASDRFHLIVENGDKPCKVGFRVNRKVGCPLNIHGGKLALSSTLNVLSKVTRFRAQPK